MNNEYISVFNFGFFISCVCVISFICCCCCCCFCRSCFLFIFRYSVFSVQFFFVLPLLQPSRKTITIEFSIPSTFMALCVLRVCAREHNFCCCCCFSWCCCHFCRCLFLFAFVIFYCCCAWLTVFGFVRLHHVLLHISFIFFAMVFSSRVFVFKRKSPSFSANKSVRVICRMV